MTQGHDTVSVANDRIRAGWVFLAFALLAEAVGGGWLIVNMVVAAVDQSAAVSQSEFATEATMMTIGIIAVVALSVLWIIVTFLGALRRRPWARSSNLTIQVLVLAAATGVLQGIMGERWIGFVLLALAVLGLLATLMVRPAKGSARSSA